MGLYRHLARLLAATIALIVVGLSWTAAEAYAPRPPSHAHIDHGHLDHGHLDHGHLSHGHLNRTGTAPAAHAATAPDDGVGQAAAGAEAPRIAPAGLSAISSSILPVAPRPTASATGTIDVAGESGGIVETRTCSGVGCVTSLTCCAAAMMPQDHSLRTDARRGMRLPVPDMAARPALAPEALPEPPRPFA